MLLTKENASAALLKSRKSKIVECGEFEVRVAALTISQQLIIEKVSQGTEDKSMLICHMLSLCCVDGDGNPIFDSPEEADKFPAEIAIKLFNECLAISAIEEGALEDKAKN